MAGRNVETKIIFKGDDQVTSITDEIERGTDKVYDNLAKTNKLTEDQINLWERLKRAVTGYGREADRVRSVTGPSQWTGRAAELRGGGRPSAAEAPGGSYQKFVRQMLDLEESDTPTNAREQARQKKREERLNERRRQQQERAQQQGQMRWARFVQQAPQQALGAMTGGIGGFSQGAGGLAGLVFGGGPYAMALKGVIGAVAGGAMIASHLAQPAFDILGTQAPIVARHGTGQERMIRAMGAEAGLMPAQALQAFLGLERFGGQAGFKPLTQMRGLGIEPDMAQSLFQAATGGGGVLGRTTGEYERLAKLIAVAIADKTKLPSVPQYLEQMTSLLQLTSQYTGDLRDTGVEQVAAIAKWQETSGSSMLRGTRGAQMMASLTGWVARAEDPAQQAIIYQSLRSSPVFMAAAQERFKQLGLNFGPGQEYQQFAFMRTNPMAAITALGGVRQLLGGNRAMAAIAMAPSWNMTPEQALTLQDIAAKAPSGRPEAQVQKFIEEEFKKKTGADLSAVMSGQEPIMLQRQLATTANNQLNQAMLLAADVAIMKNSLNALVDDALPILIALTKSTNWLIGGVKSGIDWLTDWGDKRTPEEKQAQEDYARKAAGGNPAVMMLRQGKTLWSRQD